MIASDAIGFVKMTLVIYGLAWYLFYFYFMVHI